jgi:CheY-like chemotaxis protein
LATVHGIVLAHGGGLLVRSRLGEGSVFEVVLPRATGKPPPPKPVPLCAPARIAPGQASVLLVDDDPDFGEMMFKVLERHGYEVSPCSNPLEAIEALRSGDRWDAVIADQTMPGMTGLDLIREIAAVQPGVPCVLCTGFAVDSLDEDKLKAAGVSVLLRKPIDTDKLIAIVDELVAAHLNADAPPAGGES